jgi:predicted lipoprotein
MKRMPAILCCLFVTGGLFWLFPLLHVVRIQSTPVSPLGGSFNAAEFATSFWSQRLIPSLDQAPDAAFVLKAFREDPQTAREKFGRKVGLSRMRLFVLRGSGKIVTLDKKGFGIALEPDKSEPDIILQTGLLFGNTVRDVTGLIDASNFANSQHFNEVSTELNRIVEARVIPTLKEPAVSLNQQLEFVGCVEIQDDARIDLPLTIIPLDVRARKIIERPLLSDGPHVR